MKSFKQFIAERKITINSDKELVKALFDVEANTQGKKAELAAKAAEYIEDNELDYEVAKMITDMAAARGATMQIRPLIDAIEDYVEENL